ncbi:MAG: hypothetical protein GY771_16535 [bacterium]|nr:hypothetical protein [bacterium]
MSRADNYPDDIRQYDNDPRSPFYKDSDMWICGAATHLAATWLKELDDNTYIEALDWTRADVDVERGDQDVEFFLYEEAIKYVGKYREDFEPTTEEG